MNNVNITEFIKDRVYPEIDAVQEGLLDYFRPSKMSTAGSYTLACPACGAKEGFYYPGSTHINCPRKNECGEATSIWDALLKTGVGNSEIVSILCKAANVEVPSKSRNEPAAAPGHLQPGKAIVFVTQYLATKNPHLLKELQSDRKLTDLQMQTMKLGVYTNAQEVLTLLAKKGVTKEVAVAKGYVEMSVDAPDRVWSGMTNRVVGYWNHPDGDVRLWGRIPSGKGDKQNPKYRFCKCMKKDIPYLFNSRKNTIPIGVEGTFDAWSLQFADFWGIALGQSGYNADQAAFLASKGITEAAHMVDGDRAGYEGALASIRHCESVGITLGIVALGEGMDDADALRQANRTDVLATLIDEKRINAGEFMARMCSHYLASSPPNLKGIYRVQALVPLLTPVSAAKWNDFALSLGITMDTERSAAMSFAGLLTAGLPVSQAASIVSQRTGYRISIVKEGSLNG